MKPDFSYQVLEKYFALEKSDVVILHSNNTILTGELIGYFKDENETIILWQMLPQTLSLNLAVDPFGYQQGILIKLTDIIEITFTKDDTTIPNTQ